MTSQAPTAEIRLLPSEVVDQIAAGEVVERPAHMVKELVENAIDAGATSIEVEYDQGGRRVRVTDDGSGIEPKSLKLALARHATSKIKLADDLWNLSSFGFRGEALASIAAVSRLTLQSRTSTSENSARLLCEFGKLGEHEAAGGNPGTTVLIEELFSNVPARLKFLKSEAGENAQIKATLKALAIANESVEFRIRTKGRVEESWPKASSFLERAQAVVGPVKLYATAGEYNGYEAEISFASPHDVAGNARQIMIFVQGRWVQDKSLQAAVIDAYRGLLMHGEFPIAIVRLKVPTADVDVNIHPTKSQIKFRDPQTAFRAVNRTLRSALETAPWLKRETAAQAQVADSIANKMAAARSYGAPKNSSPAEEPTTRKMSIAELTRPFQMAAHSADSSAETGFESDSVSSPSIPSGASLATSPVDSIGRFDAPEFHTIQFKQKTDVGASPTSRDVGYETSLSTSHSVIETQAQPEAATGAWSRLQVLGQAHLTYILAQDNDRLVMVDQHAAHERVAYEKLMKAWMSGQAETQPLLIPQTIELEPDGAEALLSIASELEKLGIQIDQIGPQSIALRAVPLTMKEKALVKALQELASEMVEKGGGFALEKKISDLCATMACHSVVRAGQALSMDQMRHLLKQMDEFPLSSFCPHGRPVSVDYPFAKLERDFGRIV
jgi:DNA mismatch repair protein MutL